MKFNTPDIAIEGDVLKIRVPPNYIDKLTKLSEKDCLKSIEVKQYREKRSINANNYAWQLINQIAVKLGSTDTEVYYRMLRDYGTKDYIAVIKEAIPTIKKAYKIVEVVSQVKVNGKPAVQLRLIRGSSTYDTLEMSTLINGIVQEASILGIETMTPNELKSMMEGYNG